MLSKDIFSEQMERLNVLFPNWKVDISCEKTMSIWFDEFKHLDDQEFVDRVDKFVSSSNYPPTVAAVLDESKTKNKLKGFTIAN